MFNFDENYCIETFEKLLAVDSTTGQYEQIEDLLAGMLMKMNYPFMRTHKGGIITELGGEGDPLVVTAHLDDIGLMVRHINADGTLNVCPVGGLYPFYCMMENVRIHTRDGKVFTG
ncbi:MAG: peptidase M42, partial [Clostridia bacterium]|nr:peptidase M42 [Clostridia bacterium]